jgi:hypothetical protein
MNCMEAYWNCIRESEMEYLIDCLESFMNGMEGGESTRRGVGLIPTSIKPEILLVNNCQSHYKYCLVL